MFRRVSAILLISALLVLSVFVRRTLVDPQAVLRSEVRIDQTYLRSPGPAVLSAASFEHALLFADLAWLAIVQVLSEKNDAIPSHWDRVERWAWIAVYLDPQYFTIYHSVAVNLSAFARRAKSSDRLLLRGVERIPSRWELPFMLGYNAYFLHADGTRGSEWISKAARLPGAPRFLPGLAARMRFQAGDEAGAIAFLEALLRSLEEGPLKRDVLYRYQALRSAPRLRRFDAACERYRTDKGAFPASGQALVDAGFIAEPAQDEFGAAINFKPSTCTAITEKVWVREEEARERMGRERALEIKEDEEG